MSIQFVSRAPTPQELTRLKLLMSTYTDGSGYEKNADGTTRPGWRDFERIVAEWVGGSAPEGKSIFDITVPSTINNSVYGISVKSKGFSKNKFSALLSDGRVYMELCNSPAKLWEPLKLKGIFEDDFENLRKPNEIGNSVIETVHSWYDNSGVTNIDTNNSVHLTISYQKVKDQEPIFHLHSFNLEFPENIQWKYKSKKCLMGYDPEFPDEVLFDWYALSGGQLKYYPKATKAIFSSEQFKLLNARTVSITEKAKEYWPDVWGED